MTDIVADFNLELFFSRTERLHSLSWTSVSVIPSDTHILGLYIQVWMKLLAWNPLDEILAWNPLKICFEKSYCFLNTHTFFQYIWWNRNYLIKKKMRIFSWCIVSRDVVIYTSDYCLVIYWIFVSLYIHAVAHMDFQKLATTYFLYSYLID